MTFGRMPLGNGFLTEAEFADEYFFELAPAFCEVCATFQIVEQPDPAKMFHGNYAFFSQTSKAMAEHFRQFAEHVKATQHIGSDPFVVELGSNDGIMLRHFASAGIRHLGVEPSGNVAAAARAIGVNTLNAFFSADLARTIAAEHGKADVILAANVLCHIPDLASVIMGFDHLLADDGVIMFEDPYLGDVVRKTSYDQIYDEHVYLFSCQSVARIFAPMGMELIAAAPQWTHGGSMRYTIARKGRRSPDGTVAWHLQDEAALGLDRVETYLLFRKNCETSRERLTATLEDLRKNGKRVVGFGATSKSTTVTNYCGLTPSHIEFISDTTPTKQGKFSPGAHIPVKPYQAFSERYPDVALLFAWNHAAEIQARETVFTQSGGKWLTYVPEVGFSP